MSDAIYVALIALAGSVLSAYISARAVSKKAQKSIDDSTKETLHQQDVRAAVQNEKIEELTREVREHNNFATRIPTFEMQLKEMKEEIKSLKKLHMQ